METNVIGKRIKKERERKRLTREELAKVTGYGTVAIQSWEIGKNIPRVSSLIDLCDYFGCTSDYLIGRTDRRSWRTDDEG